MTIPPRLLPSLCLACAAASPAAAENLVVLSSGTPAGAPATERIHARLEAFSADGAVLRHPDAVEPLRFKPEALVAAEFDAPPRAAAKADPALALVRFNNGDAVPGRVVSCSAEKTVIETSAGRLEAPSAFVRALEFPVGGSFGTDLLGQESDWKADNNRFGGVRGVLRIQQGRMTLEGYSLHHRTAEFPASYVLSAEFGARDSFTCGFACDHPQMGQGGGYVFYVQGGRLMFMGGMPGGGQELIGQVQLPETPRTAVNRRLSLAVDGAAKTVALTVDGRTVAVFRNFKAQPKGKHVFIVNQGGKATFSRLALMPGGGVADPAKAPAADALMFVNGDRASGRLLGIADGRAVFEGEAGKLSIPVQRLRKVEFSSAHARIPEAKDGVRVGFGESQGVTLRLESIQAGRLKGVSGIFGPCEIGMDQVERIDFRPGAAKAPAADAPEDEGGADADGAQNLQVRPGVRVFRGGGGVIIN